MQGPHPGHEVALARVQGHHGLAPGPQQAGGEAAPPGPLCTHHLQSPGQVQVRPHLGVQQTVAHAD